MTVGLSSDGRAAAGKEKPSSSVVRSHDQETPTCVQNLSGEESEKTANFYREERMYYLTPEAIYMLCGVMRRHKPPTNPSEKTLCGGCDPEETGRLPEGF